MINDIYHSLKGGGVRQFSLALFIYVPEKNVLGQVA